MGKRLTDEERAFREVSEKALQQRVIDVARMYGWKVMHISDSRRQVRRPDGSFLLIGDDEAKGFPDLVLVRPPEMLVWELKKEMGKTTPEQDEWLAVLTAVPGVEVAIVRPSTEAVACKRLMRSRRAV